MVMGQQLPTVPGPVQQPHERVVIVDEENRVVGASSRADMRSRNSIHRASFVFVHNNTGQLFVQQRVAWKETYPSHFDPAPGGVVAEHESYEENARRELAEEMGIPSDAAATQLEALFDFFYADSTTRVWGRAFRCCYDGPRTLQASEVACGRWVSLHEASNLQPCCPDSRLALEEYQKRLQNGTLQPVAGISHGT